MTRIDASKKMSRRYSLMVTLNLFGEWCLITSWGAIGRSGRMTSRSFPSQAAARAALVAQQRHKERRGYRVVVPNGQGSPPLPAEGQQKVSK